MSKTPNNLLAGELAFRPATEADLGYVLETWSRSLYPEHLEADLPVFWHGLKAHVNALIAAGADITIAHLVGEPTVIQGWACRDADLLHYVFVRPAMRRLGLASSLLANPTIINTSTITRDARVILRSHPGLIHYVPFFHPAMKVTK